MRKPHYRKSYIIENQPFLLPWQSQLSPEENVSNSDGLVSFE